MFKQVSVIDSLPNGYRYNIWDNTFMVSEIAITSDQFPDYPRLALRYVADLAVILCYQSKNIPIIPNLYMYYITHKVNPLVSAIYEYEYHQRHNLNNEYIKYYKCVFKKLNEYKPQWKISSV